MKKSLKRDIFSEKNYFMKFLHEWSFETSKIVKWCMFDLSSLIVYLKYTFYEIGNNFSNFVLRLNNKSNGKLETLNALL